MQRGYVLAGRKDKIWLTSNGNKVVEGTGNNNLFSMKIRFAGEEKSALVSAGRTTLETWHLRLAHIGEKSLKSMIENKIVDGLDCDSAGRLKFCEGCVYGKMTRKPHKSAERRPCSAGQIIHGDMSGPWPVKSLGGREYCLIFKDEATSIRRIFFMRKKSEVLSCFKQFVREISVDYAGGTVKIFRSDKGTEFLNEEYDKFLLAEGIERETSPAKSPASNGFAERENRILQDRARAMLLGADLPDFMWAEAMMTAAYISNRIPFSRQKGTTPYELWYGVKPDVSHLRVFGCHTNYKDGYPVQKMDPRAKKCFLVGYTKSAGIYRVYDPSSRRVIDTREVVFNEDSAGRTDVFRNMADIIDD